MKYTYSIALCLAILTGGFLGARENKGRNTRYRTGRYYGGSPVYAAGPALYGPVWYDPWYDPWYVGTTYYGPPGPIICDDGCDGSAVAAGVVGGFFGSLVGTAIANRRCR